MKAHTRPPPIKKFCRICLTGVDENVLLNTSVTRWQDYFSIFALKYKNFAKVGSNFCQTLNKPRNVCQQVYIFVAKVSKFAKSGHTAQRFQREREEGWITFELVNGCQVCLLVTLQTKLTSTYVR